MGLFTVASEKARMDRLRAGLKHVEEKIEGFDAKVADEFESLIGHLKHTPPHLTGAEPSTAETDTYGTTAATGEALKNDGPIAPLTSPGTSSTPAVTPAPAPAAP